MILEHLDITRTMLSAGIIWGLFTLTVLATTYHYGKRSWVHPILCINIIFGYFILIPIAYMGLTGWNSNWYDETYYWLLVSLLLFGVSYAELFLGYYVGTAITRVLFTGEHIVSDGGYPQYRHRRSTSVLNRLNNVEMNTTYILSLGLCGFCVGLMFYLYYVHINGGFIRLLTVQPRIAFQHINGTARYRWLGKMGIYGGFVTIGISLYDRLSNNPRWHDILLSIVVSTITMAVAIGFRERLVILILGAYIAMYVYTSDLIQPRYILLIGSLGITGVLLFSAIESLILGGNATKVLLTSFIYTIRVDLFAGLLPRIPSAYPFQYGATLLAMIPIDAFRLPMGYGEQLDMIFGGPTDHHLKSAMLPGELYLNFGIIGIVGGHMIIGFIIGCLTTLCVDHDYTHMRPTWTHGYYPIVILGLLSSYPTNAMWGAKTVLFMVVPPTIAIIVVLCYQSYT